MLRKLIGQYLVLCGVAAHLALVAAAVVFFAFLQERSFGEIVQRVESRFGRDYPSVVWPAMQVVRTLGLPTRKEVEKVELPPFPGPEAWPLHGILPYGLLPQRYDAAGRPVQSEAASVQDPRQATGRIVQVRDMDGLRRALKHARAGDEITLAAGLYQFKGHRLSLGENGSRLSPIYLRAENPGAVILELDTLEGFYVDKSFWIFENLRIQGSCGSDSRCEHAFHVVGDAQSVVIRNNELIDFNAAIKVNMVRRGETELLPDFGLVQNNSLYNTRPRQTSNPATPVNINAGSGWVVSANFVADFSKAGGDRISYAGFMKSNSFGGVFERNLVVCHWKLPGNGDTRLGLSFGGGGTGEQFCRGGSCGREHSGGVIRNNIIARCPMDVGIYLNRASGTRISNNLVVGTRGIDVRFPESSAVIENNVIFGRIRDRDGGSHQARENIIDSECGWFGSLLGGCPAEALYLDAASGDFRVSDPVLLGTGTFSGLGGEQDFCGTQGMGGAVIGPIAYPAAANCLPTGAAF
jgi:hypothetical protein